LELLGCLHLEDFESAGGGGDAPKLGTKQRKFRGNSLHCGKVLLALKKNYFLTHTAELCKKIDLNIFSIWKFHVFEVF
jgi:hypothetical protein